MKIQITLFGYRFSVFMLIAVIFVCYIIACYGVMFTFPTLKATSTPVANTVDITRSAGTAQVPDLPKPTNTFELTAIPEMSVTPLDIEMLTLTPPYYHIPSDLLGQRFGLYECTHGSCDPPELPDEVQARVGETVFTTVDGVRLEVTLQSVAYSIKRDKWREIITTFEFYNPSNSDLTIDPEKFFNAWGNFENWRGAIVVLNTGADFDIRPGVTIVNIQWTTEAWKNLIVWITINSQTDRRFVILDENSAIYRVEFPPVPTRTPTPTRTPIH